MVRPMLIDLNLDEIHYYPFMITINMCEGSCNTTVILLGKIYAPDKTEDMNLEGFNMAKKINELKTLTKYISCQYRCIFYGKERNIIQKWNNDKYQCQCKKPIRNYMCERDYAQNPSTCVCRCYRL